MFFFFFLFIFCFFLFFWGHLKGHQKETSVFSGKKLAAAIGRECGCLPAELRIRNEEINPAVPQRNPPVGWFIG